MKAAETRVSLFIRAKDISIDPEIITVRTGIHPTKIVRTGDIISSRGEARSKRSYWLLRAKDISEHLFREQLDSIFSQLRSGWQELKSLLDPSDSIFIPSIICAIYTYAEGDFSFFFDDLMIHDISEINSWMAFDVYSLNLEEYNPEEMKEVGIIDFNKIQCTLTTYLSFDTYRDSYVPMVQAGRLILQSSDDNKQTWNLYSDISPTASLDDQASSVLEIFSPIYKSINPDYHRDSNIIINASLNMVGVVYTLMDTVLAKETVKNAAEINAGFNFTIMTRNFHLSQEG